MHSMDETILLPSPNWFQVSGIAVSPDGWIVYGGPNKSLCVLEPVSADNKHVVQDNSKFRAHTVSKAHTDKIVSVDISPSWPSKKVIISGSADGSVKLWTPVEINNDLQIKIANIHYAHSEREEVVAVAFSDEAFAITVGSYGNLVKWDTNSNVVRKYNHLLKSFRPVCMSCSHHTPLNVAIGTKQGVLFVLDLSGKGKIIYKVRALDEEILNLSWCPKFEVEVKKTISESFLAARIDRIRNAPECNQSSSSIDVGQSAQLETDKSVTESCDESEIVEVDDMFDMYKDPEDNEFGHKKYQPKDIYVKVKMENEESETNDYLTECMKLKEEILQRKNETEPSLESLVDAMDKAHVTEPPQNGCENDNKKEGSDSSCSTNIHTHLLATVGKSGSLQVWSSSGKIVASCCIKFSGQKQWSGQGGCLTALWYKPDVLLVADGKGQLLECNPLSIDGKSKMKYSVVHTEHIRGLYAIKSTAPRVQTGDESEDWPVWTAGQDRMLVQYSIGERKALTIHHTCGGFIYSVVPCPYDAKRIAVSVGDGAVRVWQAEETDEDETKLHMGQVTTYWQNVLGKVLLTAWHPTRENLLAFSTAEARVGLIETTRRGQKAAKAFPPAFRGDVYGLCWASDDRLYASGAGDLVYYDAGHVSKAATQVPVIFENKQWKISEVQWTERALLVGSTEGAVAALTPHPPHLPIAAAYPYVKMIYCISWHPQQVSEGDSESPHKNLIAVCSSEKNFEIAILELAEAEDGSIKLSVWKKLSGHKAPVIKVVWNPHKDAQLLSTSKDFNVRIWDAVSGSCLAIFGGHKQVALSGCFLGLPALSHVVVSGGVDATLRLWKITDHPPESYVEPIQETAVKKHKKKNKEEDKDVKSDKTEEQEPENEFNGERLATNVEKVKATKSFKKFLLPTISREIYDNSLLGCKKLLKKRQEKKDGEAEKDDSDEEDGRSCEFIKIFGTINEVNEVLDMELENHQKLGAHESWIMLSIFRGHIDDVVKYATQRDILCPYVLSITPCVSFKYWKDATQLYLAQMDRLSAKGHTHKLHVMNFGDVVFRKAATLLSIHDIRGAINALMDEKLFKEAYILCRVRYMDSIAEEILLKWAKMSLLAGDVALAALCHIVLGDLVQAATVLGQSNDEGCLSLAADLAKLSGQATYAQHIEEKSEQIKQTQNKEEAESVEEALQQLPTKMELLLKKEVDEKGDS